MINSLMKLLTEQGVSNLKDKCSYRCHIISGNVNKDDYIYVITDKWLKFLKITYSRNNSGYRITTIKNALLSFFAVKWQISAEEFSWKIEDQSNNLVQEVLSSQYWKAKSYVRDKVLVVNLEKRQEEYDEKYANYYGWQKSGYNKYYQYRATAKNFLAKLATVDDLLFMKAIIEKSLEEVGE